MTDRPADRFSCGDRVKARNNDGQFTGTVISVFRPTDDSQVTEARVLCTDGTTRTFWYEYVWREPLDKENE